MCLDPVSLGIAAVGTGISAIGGGMQRRDQAEATRRNIEARNAVLRDSLRRQEGFQGQNTAFLNEALETYTPAGQAGALDAATGNRDALIGSTVSAPTVATAEGTPSIIGDTIASKLKDAFTHATNVAKAKAKASAYGDVHSGNARTISDTSGNIDMVNNFARGESAILGDQQELAGAAVYRPPSAVGSTLTSIGNLMAGLGGSGRAAGWSLPSFGGGGSSDALAGITGGGYGGGGIGSR